LPKRRMFPRDRRRAGLFKLYDLIRAIEPQVGPLDRLRLAVLIELAERP
jgi:hypothetical protein